MTTTCDELLIKDPSAPVVVGGPAPVVISGHRPGEDRHGENIFDGDTAPVVPLAVGLAPLGSGHRAMDENPLRGAAAAETEMFEDDSLRPKPVTKNKTRSRSSKWGGDKSVSRTSTSKSSTTTSHTRSPFTSAPTNSNASSRPSEISSPGDKPHGHEGPRTASSTSSSASLPSVSATVAKLEKGIERSKISKRTRIPKTYSDVLKHIIHTS